MHAIKLFRLQIAAIIHNEPQTLDTLLKHPFFRNMATYGIELQLHTLDNEGALSYEDDNDLKSTMYISEEYAKQNDLKAILETIKI